MSFSRAQFIVRSESESEVARESCGKKVSVAVKVKPTSVKVAAVERWKSRLEIKRDNIGNDKWKSQWTFAWK